MRKPSCPLNVQSGLVRGPSGQGTVGYDLIVLKVLSELPLLSAKSSGGPQGRCGVACARTATEEWNQRLAELDA